MIIVFITCKNKKEAGKISMSLLKKRLAACTVIIPGVYSAYFWPSKNRKNHIEKSGEAILLVKTLKQKFPFLEREVTRLHSYRVPSIAEIQVKRIYKPYFEWLKREVL
jgi:periplasmic divalent cation tolerance protein